MLHEKPIFFDPTTRAKFGPEYKGDGTREQPFASFNDAVEACGAGVAILMASGTNVSYDPEKRSVNQPR